MEMLSEVHVEQVTELCSIVDRPEMKVVGIALPISYESRGYGGYYDSGQAGGTINDYFYTKKLAAEGEIALLSSLIEHQIKGREIVTVRTEVQGDGNYKVIVGMEVSSFDGLPDSVEKVTVPGGIYLHITQLEVNGDNPGIPYDAAFNHLEELYLSAHPEYTRDWSRHVIARFRQANCASVFVPLAAE